MGAHFWIGVYGSGSLLANLVDTSGFSHSWRSETNIVVPNLDQHVGMSYDKSSGLLRFYLNGVKVTEHFLGIFTPQTTYPLAVGYRPEGEHFGGSIDELSLYNKVLADAEFRAIYNAGSAGKCRETPPPPPAAGLLNIDFGVGTNSAKVGLAATGQTANDFWNLYSRDDGNGGYRTFGTVSNLKRVDGTASTVGLTVTNAPGAWHNGAADPMYDVYLYPFNGGSITVTVANLPAGSYDFYLYGHGGPNADDQNSVFNVHAGNNDYGMKAT